MSHIWGMFKYFSRGYMRLETIEDIYYICLYTKPFRRQQDVTQGHLYSAKFRIQFRISLLLHRFKTKETSMSAGGNSDSFLPSPRTEA